MGGAGVDLEGFERELRALRAEAVAALGPDDVAHLKKLERWGLACTALGYATAWLGPNPVSMALLSLGSTSRWTIIAHHVLHKGLDRLPGTPARLTSKGFATGWRRLWDWPEWMDPQAWCHEHNVLHHAYTNEVADPDLVEHNLEALRRARLPTVVKWALLALSASTWKATYYAPNTLQVLQRRRRRTPGDGRTQRDDGRGPETTLDAFDPRTPEGREVWRAMLPYALARFALVPALFAPLGPLAALSVALNSLGAEWLSNLHTFLIIVPNHAGEDLARFDGPPASRGEWFLRQVQGSVNFRTGGDVNDFLHGFLNYQVEHHLFPDLPPRAYQRLQPKVMALCERFGVPYRQASVWARLRHLVRVATGAASMRR
ncbi:MAG: fatty acid desaturase [Myxococcaceae bacterium]|nr:fatty acid desaturase [Myxococcaceae bacterium]MCA3011826.1 fatty acid desaturase [Myxococcaceae bacterium]